MAYNGAWDVVTYVFLILLSPVAVKIVKNSSVIKVICCSFFYIQFSVCLDSKLFLGFLGKHSTSIWLIHMLIIEIIRLLDYKLLGNSLYQLGYVEGFWFAGLVIAVEICILVVLNKFKEAFRVGRR